jgi:hypothetical protein
VALELGQVLVQELEQVSAQELGQVLVQELEQVMALE